MNLFLYIQHLNIRFQSIILLQIHCTSLLKFYQYFSCSFLLFIFSTLSSFIYINNKKEPCTITRSFSLSYIFIYVLGLLNIPLIHVFSTYMLGILRIHHPSLHCNMSEFHFLQYQRRLIYQPSPMSVSCQSTSVV